MPKEITRGRLPSTMESSLAARDTVGVQDFVLLHDHTSSAEFMGNLKKRFSNDIIYVSIHHSVLFCCSCGAMCTFSFVHFVFIMKSIMCAFANLRG